MDLAGSGPAPQTSPPLSPALPFWRRILGERPDETVLRLVFRTLVLLTVAVLGWDLFDRIENPPPIPAETLLPGEQPQLQPFLPSIRPDVTAPEKTRPGRSAPADLQKPMAIELVAGGRLEAKGTITPGTAARFRAEIEKRGDYVKSVVLDSPGGSVQDALAMSKLIRERKLDTRVEATGLCASSCPLVFAGGVARIAEKGAAIGVHQVFSAGAVGAAPMQGAEGMARAQQVSAECQRHLVAMGIDPRVWIHAMETPPQELFYFTPAELTELKLATVPRPQTPNAPR